MAEPRDVRTDFEGFASAAQARINFAFVPFSQHSKLARDTCPLFTCLLATSAAGFIAFRQFPRGARCWCTWQQLWNERAAGIGPFSVAKALASAEGRQYIPSQFSLRRLGEDNMLVSTRPLSRGILRAFAI